MKTQKNMIIQDYYYLKPLPPGQNFKNYPHLNQIRYNASILKLVSLWIEKKLLKVLIMPQILLYALL